MSRVQYTGQVPSAPPGQLLWEPDEIREVPEGIADYLTRNVNFTLLPDDSAAAPPAPDQPADYDQEEAHP